jgi:D-alanine-D-alanine ligase
MISPPVAQNIETVLLVADIYESEACDLALDRRRDLEKSSLKTVSSILQALADLGLPAMHLQTLDDLSERAAQRREGDLVLSIFGGDRSRNRMALVPAICESFDIRFIGPDVYGRIICQDKEISKRLALQCGVLTPSYCLARTESDLARVRSGRFPMVVKPNLEGSSIGISERCIVHDLQQLRDISRSLLTEFGQPVLIEEFAKGKEVSFNLIETGADPHTRLAEVRMIGHPNYFDDHLFSASIKAPWNDLEMLALDNELADADRQALHRLIEAVGGVGYCRVDGKLLNGRFHFLELTPDAWLDPNGSFALSFTQTGWSYPEVLAHVLASEPAGRRRPASND